MVLDGASGPIEVALREEMSEPILTACHANVTGSVRTFTLASMS